MMTFGSGVRLTRALFFFRTPCLAGPRPKYSRRAEHFFFGDFGEPRKITHRYGYTSELSIVARGDRGLDETTTCRWCGYHGGRANTANRMLRSKPTPCGPSCGRDFALFFGPTSPAGRHPQAGELPTRLRSDTSTRAFICVTRTS